MYKKVTARCARPVRAGSVALTAVMLLGASEVLAQSQPPAEPPADWGATSIDHLNVPYPYPVEYLDVEVYGTPLRLAYMDAAPVGPANGQTVVFFHGFNFAGYAFGHTMEILRNAGFRTIAIDRLGFGRSSKPEIHYNFHIPARNTKRLLDALGIEQAAIVGHSMGGIVASRFAMTYPETTSHVAFVNQIGLTDQRPGREWNEPSTGTARPTPLQYYRQVVASHARYYVQGWKPEYLEWAEATYGLIFSGEFDRWQRVRSLLGQSMFEDPVVYDWQHISSKALVIGGAIDPLSQDFAADARNVAEQLQNAQLVLYANVGHNPQFEHSDEFHADLIRFLESDPDEPADQSWRDSDWGR
ncbi:MAG: alpha/beta hydrolase [Gemmatimonadota bacterium]|nr:alpha/beta hydrolase [Gemmatimonadota bacterium]